MIQTMVWQQIMELNQEFLENKIIKNYVDFLEKFKTKEISLISYDNFNTQTTFNPEELNNFFDNKLNVNWKDSLIEGYNKKTYLFHF